MRESWASVKKLLLIVQGMHMYATTDTRSRKFGQNMYPDVREKRK
jgi:hypothetical protein